MQEDPERTIVRRQLATDRESPSIQIVEVVSEIDGREMTELTTMWGCVDDVLDHLFSDPPDAEAQMTIEFSYEGYRITVEQDGHAEFVAPGND